MTNFQKVLIVVGTAALFQVAQVLAGIGPEDLIEPRKLFVTVLVSVANAVGLAVIALKTTGGLTMAPPAGGEGNDG